MTSLHTPSLPATAAPPGVDVARPVQPVTRRRPTLACARCRARRVKCDRAQPSCSNCVKASVACVQVDPFSAVPRRLTAQQHVRRTWRQGLADSSARLQNLEQLVERLAREIQRQPQGQLANYGEENDDNHAARTRSESGQRPSSAGSLDGDGNDALAEELRGMVVSSPRSRYFSPFSWAAISEQIADIRHLLEQQTNDPDEPNETHSGHPPESSTFPPIFSEPSRSNIPSVPLLSEELSVTLIRVYMTRVDPIIRIIHTPSFLNRLQIHYQMHFGHKSAYAASMTESHDLSFTLEAQSSLQSGSSSASSSSEKAERNTRAFEALIYAVYYAAASSIAGDGAPPDLPFRAEAANHNLAAEYKRAAELALEDADFVQNETLETLQAIVLLLSTTPRGSDPGTPWIRLGIAIRIAQAMGVHRDGSHYDLKPIETEVRRRIWAQICLLDLRAAEELGCEPTIIEGTYDTCLPSNTSDNELSQLELQAFAAQQSEVRSISRLAPTAEFQDYMLRNSDLSAPEWINQQDRTNLPTDAALAAHYYQTHQSAPGNSPFSNMTFSLVRYETVRLFGKLLCPKYQPEDDIFNVFQNSDPGGNRTRRYTSSQTIQEKTFWVDQLERRFENVYKVQELDATDPMQTMTAKVAKLLIAKARFLIDLQAWKECCREVSNVNREQRRNRLFQNATAIIEQTIALGEESAHSNWLWYVNTFTEVYASTFVLFNLARGCMPPELSEKSWWAIDRLFPACTEAVSASHPRSPLQKLLALARARRSEEAGSAVEEPSSRNLVPTDIFSRDSSSDPLLSQINVYSELDLIIQDASWLDQPHTGIMADSLFLP